MSDKYAKARQEFAKEQQARKKLFEEIRKKKLQDREKDNARVKQWLNERIKRNEEMGLGSSPQDTDVEYDDELEKKYGFPTKGAVKHGETKIRLNPTEGQPIKGDEFLEKYVIAHELEHVNQKRPFNGVGEHEKRKLGYADRPFEEETSRRARSILQPSFQVGDFRNTFELGEVTNTPELLKKYAKQAGVPVDEIIDALVMNSAVGNDKDVKAAHDKTKENQKQGRGLFGELFENKMSTEDVYQPWKDLKETRKKK